MANRASQALAKSALEPEWESKFEPNSYGFRPGRSAHDAMETIYIAINKKAKYVLDADIAKCFDRIRHSTLLTKLATFPTLRRVIQAWLKAGIMDGNQLFPTTEGTPQGSPISPLLANVALHGLETALRAAFPNRIGVNGSHTTRWKPIVNRYADDFLIIHQDLAVIEKCKQITQDWLSELGLELKPSKTSITHTLHHHQGKVGFNFLGWEVRQYPVGKNHAGRNNQYLSLDFKTIIKPAKEALARHLAKIKEVISRHKSKPQKALIKNLNSVIKGWCNYYAPGVSKTTFGKADNLIYYKLQRWAKRRHPKKSGHWRSAKYWRTIGNNRWTFATLTGDLLQQHRQTPIVRHVKVKERKTPFDGDWIYWSSRQGRYPGISNIQAKLLKVQKGKCLWCGLYFRDEDLLEIDHIIPKANGGRDNYLNKQILHRHCHDNKTRLENFRRVRSTYEKGHTIEERYEVNISRTVLKTSRVGDYPA